MGNLAVSNDFADKLVNVAEQQGIEYEVFEGVLNDSYIFYNTKNIKLSGIRRTEYIVIQSVYGNEWSSSLELIVTDSAKKIEKYKEWLSA